MGLLGRVLRVPVREQWAWRVVGGFILAATLLTLVSLSGLDLLIEGRPEWSMLLCDLTILLTGAAMVAITWGASRDVRVLALTEEDPEADSGREPCRLSSPRAPMFIAVGHVTMTAAISLLMVIVILAEPIYPFSTVAKLRRILYALALFVVDATGVLVLAFMWRRKIREAQSRPRRASSGRIKAPVPGTHK
jgi:lysylphosphatidylglycerol synthetase-like protein (DUF2156 family)